MKFILRVLVNAIAIYAAIALLQATGIGGVTMEATSWLDFIWLALIFAVINAILKPVLKVIGCPVLILTFGLGSLLINTLLFWLSGLIGQYFGVGFTVDGFWPAFFGGLVVSVVSMVLTLFVKDDLEGRRRS